MPQERGIRAQGPTEIPARGWWDIMMRVKSEVATDHVSVVSAGVAFFGLLAIFPAIGALISIAGFFLDPSNIADQLETMVALLPENAAAIIHDQILKVTGGDETATGFAEAIGKTPVVVKDAPGFASSRLGVAIALEAIRMVEEGVASPEDIDAAMVLGYKFPVGPLALTDIVGLDVRLGIAEYLESQLGERFAPPQLMRDMVARGELGRKSGKGFFDYSKG